MMEPNRTITIVRKSQRDFLSDKAVTDYYEYRKPYLTYLLRMGKDPEKEKGYSPYTVCQTGQTARGATHAGAGRPDRHRVSATLQENGVTLSCRGETALLSATEARDIATRLEQIVASEDWGDGDTRELIAFLRRGANNLDDEKSEPGFREEFDQ